VSVQRISTCLLHCLAIPQTVMGVKQVLAIL